MANQGVANSTRTGVTGPEIVDGYRAAEFENVIGTADADTIIGDKNANVIEGGDSGDDLNGGLGNDTVSYAGSMLGVNVDLSLQGSIDNNGNIDNRPRRQSKAAPAMPQADRLWGFENIIGSATGDTLTGDAKANIISGGGGFDTLLGGGGNDILLGGDRNDTYCRRQFDGAWRRHLRRRRGLRHVDYSNEAGGGITVTLGVNGASATVMGKTGGAAVGDKLINVESIVGTDFNDVLTGNNRDHDLRGGIGNDTLTGGTGSSPLDGGTVDDIIYGSVGANESYAGGSRQRNDWRYAELCEIHRPDRCQRRLGVTRRILQR